MANVFSKGLSFFGLSDPEEVDDDEIVAEEDTQPDETAFDRDDSLSIQSSRLAAAGRGSASSVSSSSSNTTFPKAQMNRITTIHPRNYDEVQAVGRALRDGVPVVLNLTGVADKDATRIVDFATGVVFGVRGSVERVTPRVWLLSPAAVSIKAEQTVNQGSATSIFE
ncbi:cell division protein SepF [Alloscardovia venturai]|uniref:Cell division protein SepF n=1 Tax=Alloscardovia venturai TaxID=1769421 RepID=A0ABW2Y768_9BIFI